MEAPRRFGRPGADHSPRAHELRNRNAQGESSSAGLTLSKAPSGQPLYHRLPNCSGLQSSALVFDFLTESCSKSVRPGRSLAGAASGRAPRSSGPHGDLTGGWRGWPIRKESEGAHAQEKTINDPERIAANLKTARKIYSVRVRRRLKRRRNRQSAAPECGHGLRRKLRSASAQSSSTSRAPSSRLRAGS